MPEIGFKYDVPKKLQRPRVSQLFSCREVFSITHECKQPSFKSYYALSQNEFHLLREKSHSDRRNDPRGLTLYLA